MNCFQMNMMFSFTFTDSSLEEEGMDAWRIDVLTLITAISIFCDNEKSL